MHQRHEDSVRTLREAYDRGVRHFDTAASYGNGRSEQLIGQQLRTVRDRITIATKGLYHPPPHVEAGIRKSLRRLSTDYVDIYYIHWPKPDIDLRPMVEALEKARARGLVRYLGVSNFSREQILPLLEAGTIDYCQFGYNLIWRGAERELIPFCIEKDIRPVTYGSLAEGLLAGENRLPSRLPQEDPRRRLVFCRPEIAPRVEAVLERIFAFAGEAGIAPGTLALAWNMSRPWARTVLFGARTPGQLAENLRAREVLDAWDSSMESRLDELTGGLSELFCELFGGDENMFGHRPR